MSPNVKILLDRIRQHIEDGRDAVLQAHSENDEGTSAEETLRGLYWLKEALGALLDLNIALGSPGDLPEPRSELRATDADGVVGNARQLLTQLRRKADLVHGHHRTGETAELLQDVVEIHEYVSGIEELLDQAQRESHTELRSEVRATGSARAEGKAGRR